MRLIDADAFKDWVDERYHYTELGEVVRSWLDERPIFALMPVKSGKWIEKSGDIICSQCGIEIPDEITWLRGINEEGPYFCPNCGAKMEEQG